MHKYAFYCCSCSSATRQLKTVRKSLCNKIASHEYQINWKSQLKWNLSWIRHQQVFRDRPKRSRHRRRTWNSPYIHGGKSRKSWNAKEFHSHLQSSVQPEQSSIIFHTVFMCVSIQHTTCMRYICCFKRVNTSRQWHPLIVHQELTWPSQFSPQLARHAMQIIMSLQINFQSASRIRRQLKIKVEN